MKLIYRAQLLEYTPAPAQPYRKPCALNWRFQAPGETYGNETPLVAPYRRPQALNWRFQLAAGV